jgi:hypothetical protein
MLYREIIADYSEIHSRNRLELCGQEVEFFNVKHFGIKSNHQALKG